MRHSVYFDSNVLITAFESDGFVAEYARRLLSLVEASIIAGITSELTLSEVLVMPLRRNDTVLAATYQSLLRPAGRLQVLPITRDLLHAAAGLRARRQGLKLPDAIHLATAAEAHCTAVIFADQGMQPAGGIPRLDAVAAHSLLTGRPEPT